VFSPDGSKPTLRANPLYVKAFCDALKNAGQGPVENGIQEVSGSTPLSSTTYQGLSWFSWALLLEA
jgi:hypothetical protein